MPHPERARKPFVMGQARLHQCLHFMLKVVCDAPYGCLPAVHNKIGGASIAVVRKTHASGIRNSYHGEVSDERPVNVAVNRNRCVNTPEGLSQIGVAGLRHGSPPDAIRTGVNQSDRLSPLYVWLGFEPANAVFPKT